jgi:integrase
MIGALKGVTKVQFDMTGINQLPSGNWRVRKQYKRKILGGVYKSLEQAVGDRDAILRKLADEDFVPSDGTSVAELGPRFLRARKGNRNHRNDRQRWERHVAKAEYAKRLLGTVTRGDILDWLADLHATETAYENRENKPLSWQTRKHLLILVRRFFTWAVDRNYRPDNPALGIRVELEDGDEEEGYQKGWYLDPVEQAELLALASDDPERHLIAFAMGTGLRLGELLCLHRDDVHVDDQRPFVEVKYGSWDPTSQRFRSPKSRKGVRKTRVVPLFGMALEATRAWLEILPFFTKKNPRGLMFPTRRGALRTKAPKVWAKVQERFGVRTRLGRRVWWHLLRHTFASSLVAGWWGGRRALDEVRTLMGHSSVKVTEMYAHLADQRVHDIGTEIQAGWASRHVVVTTPENSREYPEGTRPSKPRVAGSSPAGRAPLTLWIFRVFAIDGPVAISRLGASWTTLGPSGTLIALAGSAGTGCAGATSCSGKKRRRSISARRYSGARWPYTSVVIRGSLWRRMRCTAAGFAPDIINREAVVCRRS